MDDKSTGEVKVQSTPTKTRRTTRASTKSSTTNTRKAPTTTKTRQSSTSVAKTPEVKNDALEKATLKAMAVSLVEAMGSKEGVTITEKIKQLDKSLKEEKKLKAALVKNINKLAKHQAKVAKLEEKITKFDVASKNLQERCTALKSKIDLYKDELATEMAKM